MIKPVLFRSNHLYIFGLILLVSGLPLSFFVTSVSQMVLTVSFFLEGDVSVKFRRYLHNKPALIITGILVLHFIGLLWTTDYAEGFKDIRIKAPLLILPLIMGGTTPLTKKQFNLVMAFFIASVFAGTMVSMAVLTGIIHREITDIREIFIFHVSHIRFALFICISLFSFIYFIFSNRYSFSGYQKILFVALIIWFLIFLVIMESVTGIIITVVIGFLMLLYRAFVNKNGWIKIALVLFAFMIPSSLIFFAQKITKQYYVKKDVPIDVNAKTAAGNPYIFSLWDPQRENGYPVWIYICEEEMRKEWNARSRFHYDTLDMRGQDLKFTLIRFLASKGLRKDGEAIRTLSDREVHSIEKGIANVNYQSLSSLKARTLKIVWEYDQFMHTGDMSGHSVLQRVEFWKTALALIRDQPFTGVGTGDMPMSYHDQYIKENTTLTEHFRLRAHNQFLSITVAFGLIGLLYFLFALIAPMVIAGKYLDYFYVVFIITAILSMLTEDTIETQTGVTFFAFFNCLFLFRQDDHDGK